MTDRIVRAVIAGSSAGAVRAFEETAVAADAAAKETSGSFKSEGSKLDAMWQEMSGGFTASFANVGTEAAGAAETAGKELESVGTKSEEAEKKGSKLFSTLFTGASNLAGNVGLPKFAKDAGDLGEKMHSTGSEAEGLIGGLGKIPVPGLAAAAAFALVSVEAFKVGMEMQSLDARIATASGTTMAAAKQIGDAFLGTAGTSEFSGQEMAAAFAGVAGQLKATVGHALSAAEALQVMHAADDLATAKQIDLGSALSAVSAVMQSYGLRTKDAASVSDVLFNASNATGTSVSALATAVQRVHSTMGAAAPPIGQLGGFLVDLAQHGEVGRQAMSALSSVTTSLFKPVTAVNQAEQMLKTTADALDPSLRSLVDRYNQGEISAKAYKAATSTLSPAEMLNVKAYQAAEQALQKAQQKLSDTGITIMNAQGQFVGLSSVIGQLHDKIQGESEAQALATVTTVFGASAAAKMLAVVEAGPAAYDKATASVTKLNSAHDAANTQSKTLDVEWKTLKATVSDLFAEYGEKLIPIVTEVAGVFLRLTQFLFQHKAMMIAVISVSTVGMADIAIAAVFLLTHWRTVWNGIKDAALTVWHFIDNNIVQPIETAFNVGVVQPLHTLEAVWGTVWGNIQSAVLAVWSVIKPIFDAITHAISTVTGGISSVMGLAGKVSGGITGGVSKALGFIGLASGGIVTRPTFAHVAETEPEAVIPLRLLLAGAGAVLPLPPSIGGTTRSPAFEARHTTVVEDRSVNLNGPVTIVANDPVSVVNALRAYQQAHGSVPITVRTG